MPVCDFFLLSYDFLSLIYRNLLSLILILYWLWIAKMFSWFVVFYEKVLNLKIVKNFNPFLCSLLLYYYVLFKNASLTEVINLFSYIDF